MSDTRTNAGVDNIATFRKMFTWTVPGERVITLMAAGNLATTQAVISLLDERSKAPADRAPSMFQVAQIVGDMVREVIQANAMSGQQADSTFNATMILGGQIATSDMRLFMIYPEGNFIEASDDTPFFQIGETKYGRPILVRAYNADIEFEDAVKLLMVSFDSTIKANLTVGLPLDLQIYEADTMRVGHSLRIEMDDPFFQSISDGWGEALRQAFDSLPNFRF